MHALTPQPLDELRHLRRTVAAAIERLRSLELAHGNPAIAGEVACAALSALSTVLFAGSDDTGPRVPAELVEDEIHRISSLLNLRPEDLTQGACACLFGDLPFEHAAVSS